MVFARKIFRKIFELVIDETEHYRIMFTYELKELFIETDVLGMIRRSTFR